jgi:hypothetical protein
VPDSGGAVLLVPAFAGLGAPYWDGYARGTLVGLTRGVGKAHIARAALEAIALQVVDLVHARMEPRRRRPLAELRVDGGAARNNLLLQIQADLLGVPVVRPRRPRPPPSAPPTWPAWRSASGAPRMNWPSLWRGRAASSSPAADADWRDRTSGEWHRAVSAQPDWARRMKREAAARPACAARRRWDLLVIGGGATGLGCAVDAAARGYSTLLLEAHDFAKGTSSSRSTKLIHGGVRYLPRVKPRAGSRSPGGARHPAPQCAAPGPRTGLHRAELRLVGVAVLRHRPDAL